MNIIGVIAALEVAEIVPVGHFICDGHDLQARSHIPQGARPGEPFAPNAFGKEIGKYQWLAEGGCFKAHGPPARTGCEFVPLSQMLMEQVALVSASRLAQSRPMLGTMRHCAIMTCLLAGCSAQEPPQLRQLECVLPKGVAAADTLVLLIDTGRRDVTFANLPGQPVRPAGIGQFAYRFEIPSAAGPVRAEIQRFDGVLLLRRSAAGGNGLDMASNCKSVTRGPKV